MIHNNLACCYRRQGVLDKALMHLEAAVTIGRSSEYVKNMSATYMNMCAVLSETGRHKRALECAQNAVFHSQEGISDTRALST